VKVVKIFISPKNQDLVLLQVLNIVIYLHL